MQLSVIQVGPPACNLEELDGDHQIDKSIHTVPRGHSLVDGVNVQGRANTQGTGVSFTSPHTGVTLHFTTPPPTIIPQINLEKAPITYRDRFDARSNTSTRSLQFEPMIANKTFPS